MSKVIQVEKIHEQPLCYCLNFNEALSFSNSSELQEAFEEVFNSGSFYVVLNFKDCPALLSSHLGMIYQRFQTARKSDGRFFIIHPNEAVLLAFKRVGFDHILEFCDDLDEVLAKLA